MGKKIPIVHYDDHNRRTMIGECEVNLHENGAYSIDGEITDEHYLKMLGPAWKMGDVSIAHIGREAIEAVPILLPRRQFTAEGNLNE